MSANTSADLCKKMDMDRIKGPWSPEEDELLQQLVQKHGPRNWSLISKSIPGRSGKSCRLRWCNQLSPQVEHRAFTPEEDETISGPCQVRQQMGHDSPAAIGSNRQRHQESLELHPQAEVRFS
ncbi:UNVERIFIED_CONTAM: Transcription factor [Sesamum radiatum]|uniref:Transcription factor n=1 Tax=Sesamum radiatum TaxID=300843 RepID=A0AAW2P4S3_SESRA